MKVTEARIKLMPLVEGDNLLAFASIVFDDCFCVRDLRVINGTKGMFLSMPSRKLKDRCPGCGDKNDLRSRFCCWCGRRLNDYRWERDETGRPRLHSDICHPLSQDFRLVMQAVVLMAYEAEREREKEPGYECRYDDFGD